MSVINFLVISAVNRRFPFFSGDLWMKNIVRPNRRIYLFSDPSHAIKKWRNSMMNKNHVLQKKEKIFVDSKEVLADREIR